MKKISLKTGFVIIAIYEILYWLYIEMGDGYKYLFNYELQKFYLGVVIFPVGAIAIYFFIRWVTNKE